MKNKGEIYMKAACQHNKELLDKVVPSMAYKGGNIE